MKKTIGALVLLLSMVAPLSASTNHPRKTVHVHGYTKKDGTHVHGYTKGGGKQVHGYTKKDGTRVHGYNRRKVSH